MIIPLTGRIYLDANALIYSIERVGPYWPVIRPLWERQALGGLTLLGSELLITESLVAPLRRGDDALRDRYERVMATGMHLSPITSGILRRAAELRAAHGLKTPDAIHAATALIVGCDAFITNDTGFRRVPGLPLLLLADALQP
jgi:predicted nucleic acid-binding protein